MAQTHFRTDYRLWAMIAVCAFVALGFVDPAGVAKDDNSLWAYVGIFFRREYICSSAEVLAAIMFRAALQAVPAILGGWVAQALIVVWRSLRGRPSAMQY